MDLNCDMGESYGRYKLGLDEDVIKYVTSANVACGWHAGDPMVMNRTVKMAAEHGVGVGAHPGYPDRLGFGRRDMNCTLEEIRNYVVYQVGALQAFCRVYQTRLRHVKPHGSLYLTAVRDAEVARAIAEAVASIDPDLVLVTLAGKRGEEVMAQIGKEVGIRVVFEAFPDRAYGSDGTLVSRREPGAVIRDPEVVSDRALKMAREGKVVTIDGAEISLRAETLCVHGDTPGAINLVKAIREKLTVNGIEVKPF